MGAGHPEASMAPDKAVPEQVHLTASVAMVVSVPQQLDSEGIVAQG